MLMLTDADPEFDLRVLDAWRAQGQPELMRVDADDPGAWRWLVALWMPLSLAWHGLRYGAAIAPLVRPMGGRIGAPLDGLRGWVREQAGSVRFFWRHRRKLRAAGRIYAHDQRCGVVAFLARLCYGVPYTYDAHEIVPYRPRRTGAMRVLMEFVWERRIVARASDCMVVNKPMRRLYRRFYGPANYAVRPNDFFADHDIALRADGARLMVYVGSTGQRRQLDRMVQLTRAGGGEVLLVCPDAPRVAAALGVTRFCELAGYEPVLARQCEGNAPYFWCSFDVSVLSYRYSLPNKFFQAVALGIPVVVSQGSYLARLVRRHGFGVAIGDASGDAALLWDRTGYEHAVASMRSFRTLLREGQVVL
jgi:glycosyltransferase involved in cell wall biosynthesis